MARAYIVSSAVERAFSGGVIDHPPKARSWIERVGLMTHMVHIVRAGEQECLCWYLLALAKFTAAGTHALVQALSSADFRPQEVVARWALVGKDNPGLTSSPPAVNIDVR